MLLLYDVAVILGKAEHQPSYSKVKGTVHLMNAFSIKVLPFFAFREV